MTNDRQARAARAEKMRKEREKADRRQRNTITVAIVTIVVVLIGLAWWGIESARDDYAKNREVIEPRNIVDGGVEFPVAEGKDVSSAPLFETYEDFQCPACRSFNETSGAYLSQAAAAGEIRLRFRPFAFLHSKSRNDYPRRAMNLAMCAVDEQGPEAFWKVKDILFANQPDENTAGPTDNELLEFASSVGVELQETCVKSERFVPWIDEAKTEAEEDPGVQSTPSRFINGKLSEAWSPDELTKAIAEAS